jgi:peptide/nickel transport system permease protein
MSISVYILRRLLLLIPVLFGLTMVTFALSRIIPADPARAWAGDYASKEAVENLRKAYHLDKPLPTQYAIYVRDLVQGNWGISPMTQRPTLDDVKKYFPATIELSLFSLTLVIVVSIPLGVISAIRRNSLADHIARILAVSGAAFPTFWFGLLLQLAFYYHLGLLPGEGRLSGPEPSSITGFVLLDSILTLRPKVFVDGLRHIILPGFSLAYFSLALVARVTRSSMLAVLGQDYLRTARAKGLRERAVLLRHALKNALIPVVTVVGLQLGTLLSGAPVIETVFGWPGIGRYAVLSAIASLDFPAIMAVTLVSGLTFLLVNLGVDILYAALDPRIRLT